MSQIGEMQEMSVRATMLATTITLELVNVTLWVSFPFSLSVKPNKHQYLVYNTTLWEKQSCTYLHSYTLCLWSNIIQILFSMCSRLDDCLLGLNQRAAAASSIRAANRSRCSSRTATLPNPAPSPRQQTYFSQSNPLPSYIPLATAAAQHNYWWNVHCTPLRLNYKKKSSFRVFKLCEKREKIIHEKNAH